MIDKQGQRGSGHNTRRETEQELSVVWPCTGSRKVSSLPENNVRSQASFVGMWCDISKAREKEGNIDLTPMIVILIQSFTGRENLDTLSSRGQSVASGAA